MDREFLDELLSKTDIAALISRYLPLKKKGNTLWGCCPFHHEGTPSFAVNDEKQFYHCFGCKESGNAISFLMKMESIDFLDAVKILAEDAKMELPAYQSSDRDEQLTREKRERLYLLMRTAAKHYHENLSLNEAQTANEYLRKRQITENLIKKFGLGYSVSGAEIISFLESKGFKKSEMKEAGLIEQRADDYYDVFYGRIIYPIINNMGEVVAFGGRTLKADADFAKYRNSSQTPIFDKSKNIYGINLLKKKKQSASPIDFVIMTEGYMDVIALHKGGFDTAVASMGTALTKDQAKQLKNYSSKVYISYDGDAAGQKATLRGLDILAEAGLSVRVVSLPEGLDPDDVIKQSGAQAYKRLLDSAVTLPAFKINLLKDSHDLNDSEGKSKFAVEAVKVIKALFNPVEQEEYMKLIQSYTGYSKETLYKQAEITPSVQSEIAEPEAKLTGDNLSVAKEEKAKDFVLASIVNAKDYVDFNKDTGALLNDDFSRDIYGYALEKFKKGEHLNPTQFYSALTQDQSQKLTNLMEYQFLEGDNAEKYLDCLNVLNEKFISEERKKLEYLYNKATDPKEKKDILVQMQMLKQRK